MLQVNAVNVKCANKGLVPHGQQGITRTKDDPMHFRVYASLGFSASIRPTTKFQENTGRTPGVSLNKYSEITILHM